MALSPRDSTTADVAKARRASGRPTVSVVLLASGDKESLDRALAATSTPCREFGARLVLVWPGNEAPIDSAKSPELDLVTMAVPRGSTLAERRGLAAAQCSTDIMIFADELRACRLPWADVLAIRFGLARGSALDSSAPDWRAVLSELGVASTTSRG